MGYEEKLKKLCKLLLGRYLIFRGGGKAMKKILVTILTLALLMMTVGCSGQKNGEKLENSKAPTVAEPEVIQSQDSEEDYRYGVNWGYDWDYSLLKMDENKQSFLSDWGEYDFLDEMVDYYSDFIKKTDLGKMKFLNWKQLENLRVVNIEGGNYVMHDVVTLKIEAAYDIDDNTIYVDFEYPDFDDMSLVHEMINCLLYTEEARDSGLLYFSEGIADYYTMKVSDMVEYYYDFRYPYDSTCFSWLSAVYGGRAEVIKMYYDGTLGEAIDQASMDGMAYNLCLALALAHNVPEDGVPALLAACDIMSHVSKNAVRAKDGDPELCDKLLGYAAVFAVDDYEYFYDVIEAGL